jgi:hypothetical protein
MRDSMDFNGVELSGKPLKRGTQQHQVVFSSFYSTHLGVKCEPVEKNPPSELSQ